MEKEKETRKRCLNFYIPKIISLAYNVRLVEEAEPQHSLLDIYERDCEERKVSRDASLDIYIQQLMAAVEQRGSFQNARVELVHVKCEILEQLIRPTLLSEVK